MTRPPRAASTLAAFVLGLAGVSEPPLHATVTAPTPHAGVPAAQTGQPGLPAGSFDLPPVDAGAGTGANALLRTVPGDWVPEKPAKSMRRAQYRVPGKAGECVAFYFGPGQGGEPMANAGRWVNQFKDADGKAATASMKTRTFEVGGMMDGAAAPRPGGALLGAVARGPDASWCWKLTGPEATVAAQRAAFEKMVQSIRHGS